jgi:hypothetical protein
MSSLYVYAIVDQPDLDLPAIRGIGDAAINAMRVGDLVAVISQIDGDMVPLSRDNLLCHERVIEALMRTRTALPARFGTTTTRAEQLRHTLKTNAASYHENLDRLRGRVEIALRVGWEPDEEEPVARPRAADVADGRSYMMALLARTQSSQRRRDAAEDLATKLTVGLNELADAVVEKILPTPQLLLKAAYLVRRDDVPEIRRRIEALRASYPSLVFLATGPWPAYSFVEERNAA